MRILKLITMFLFTACGSVSNGNLSETNSCDLERAMDFAKDRFRGKVNINDVEFDKSYNIGYLIIEKGYFIKINSKDISQGSGAEIFVSRTDCKILDEKYFQ